LTEQQIFKYYIILRLDYIKRLYAANAPFSLSSRSESCAHTLLKESVPMALSYFVVYQITCPSCPTCYVGGHTVITTPSPQNLVNTVQERPVKSGNISRHWHSAPQHEMTSKSYPRQRGEYRFSKHSKCSMYIRETKPSLNTRDKLQGSDKVLQIFAEFP